MKKISTILISFLSAFSFAQFPNWSDDVAPIVYNKCAQCHHTGGIAPFPLMSYSDAFLYALDIKNAVADGHMPPWPADPNYRHFANENILSDQEKLILTTWYDNGAQSGDLGTAPTPPDFLPGGSVLDQIDLEVQIPGYTLQSNSDEYRWFVIPTSFPVPVYVSKIEVMAGLPHLIHHADISYDLSGTSAAFDALDPLPGFNSTTGAPNITYYMNAWQPGGGIAEYPDDWGIMIPPGADLLLEIHYGPGGMGQTDTTKMNLQFLTTPSPRPVQVSWMLYDSPPCLIDGPLTIPANQVVTFHQQTAPLAGAISIVSICPHMHMLGASYKVWAVTPTNDTIKLINIPHWDFHWQKYYTYPVIETLPAGTVIYSEGVYDNTIFNEHNPNSPPQTVYKGPFTTDEMFLTYFIYADYEPGDENIILDSAIWAGQQEMAVLHEKSFLKLYPNPANSSITLEGSLSKSGTLTISILNALGQEVQPAQQLKINETFNETFDVSVLPKGTYYMRWRNDEEFGVIRFVME